MPIAAEAAITAGNALLAHTPTDIPTGSQPRRDSVGQGEVDGAPVNEERAHGPACDRLLREW
ncbi:MAG TPA: hypothetical protein VGD49_13710 [Longimicrobiales bacterium]